MSGSTQKPWTEAYERFLTLDHPIPMLMAPINAEIVEYVWNAAIESVATPSDTTDAVAVVKQLREALLNTGGQEMLTVIHQIRDAIAAADRYLQTNA